LSGAFTLLRGSLELRSFGSLLSKRSALTTTPSLRNYQYVRVHGYQRLFTHPVRTLLHCIHQEAGRDFL